MNVGIQRDAIIKASMDGQILKYLLDAIQKQWAGRNGTTKPGKPKRAARKCSRKWIEKHEEGKNAMDYWPVRWNVKRINGTIHLSKVFLKSSKIE